VETENPSACATVNLKVCKSAITPYCLYLTVIKRECVTEVLINPTIRTRTRHFITRTTLHMTLHKDGLCYLWPSILCNQIKVTYTGLGMRNNTLL
jgi:hypothetical protein